MFLGVGCTIVALGIVFLILTWAMSARMVENRASDHIRDMYLPQPGTAAWDDWMRDNTATQGATYTVFYFFNITNALAVMYGGAQPQVCAACSELRHMTQRRRAQFSQIGPFIYRDNNERYVSPEDDPSLLSFYTYSHFDKIVGPINLYDINGVPAALPRWPSCSAHATLCQETPSW